MIFKTEERGGQLVLFLSLALHANFGYKREIFSCKRGSVIIFTKKRKKGRKKKSNRKKKSLRAEKREKKRREKS